VAALRRRYFLRRPRIVEFEVDRALTVMDQALEVDSA
jgi:hypothetical protein